MQSTVIKPVMALAYQWSSQPGNSRRVNGSKKVNIRKMTAELRME